MAGSTNKEQAKIETDNSVVIQCMKFTKHLAIPGKSFNFYFSLPSGPNFFLVITHEKLAPFNSLEWKKQSTSTLKTNALRKKTFLQKKNLEKQADPQLVGSQVHSVDIMKKFKCKQCDKEFKRNTCTNVITNSTVTTAQMFSNAH